MTNERSAASPAADLNAALIEARQLIADLQSAAQDGPGLAKRYAEALETVVGEYCHEFERRADASLKRIDQIAQTLAVAS